MRRVAVTGLGAITPLGLDAPSTWKAAVAGESGIDFIQAFDASEYPVRIAGEVKGFDPATVAPAKEARRMDRNVLLALGAAQEAWREGGLNGVDPARVGVVVGSAIGGLPGIVEQTYVLRDRGPDRISPFFIPSVLVDSASGQIAISLGVRGPNYAPVSACATGSHAVGEGAELIRRGDADAVLAGGTGVVHPSVDPRRLLRDARPRRRGRGPDEGLAAVRRDARRLRDVGGRVHPSARGARVGGARGATIYAEVLGYGASNDAHHMAQPEPEATGVAGMMRAALERTGVEPERVGYINAHGTSTPLGDAAETRAIKQVFGDHAYKLAVSSTKSVTGHCFGAAGAIESMMCALALHHQRLPPTINYRNPDPECDLDYVPNEARDVELDVALSNAMGLGGHNGCVLLGRL